MPLRHSILKGRTMTVREFKRWLEENQDPDEANIILRQTGGFDHFEPEAHLQDADGTSVVVASGTG